MEREIYKNKTMKMRRFGYAISSIFSIAIVALTVSIITQVL